MKAMSLEQLQRHALRTGAEVSMDGGVFNSARAQVVTPPKKPPPPAPPPAAAAPAPMPNMVSRDVLDSMLREQAAQFERQIDALRGLILAGNPTESAEGHREVAGFQPTYGKNGEITMLRVLYASDNPA